MNAVKRQTYILRQIPRMKCRYTQYIRIGYAANVTEIDGNGVPSSIYDVVCYAPFRPTLPRKVINSSLPQPRQLFVN